MWRDFGITFSSHVTDGQGPHKAFEGKVGFLEGREYKRHLVTNPLNPLNTMLTLGPPTGPHYTVYVI